MSGEIIEVWGTRKVLESGGTTVPNGSVVMADDSFYDKMVDGLGYPDGRFVLTGYFTNAPVENGKLALYAREMSIDGANNAATPEASRPTRVICIFDVDNVTGFQSMSAMAYDLPLYAYYYLHNVNTGQSVDLWKLSVQPRTYMPKV